MLHAWGVINVHKSLVGEPEGRKPLRIHRHSWEDTIKIGLKK